MAPGFIDSTSRDAVTYGSRLDQQGNTRVWEEIPLSRVRAFDEILHAKQGTTLFILSYRHSVQINTELLTRSHRPTNDKNCKLEHLQQLLSFPQHII